MKLFGLIEVKSPLFADFLMVIGVMIWGSTFFMIKDHIQYVDPVAMLVYRFLMASSLVLFMGLLQKKAMFKDLPKGLFVGVFLWLIYAPQNIGMEFTSASNSAFITALFVAFVPLFSIFFFRQWPTIPRLFAGVLALIGLWYLTGGFDKLNKGDLITLIAPVSCALYMLLSDLYLKKGMDPLVLSFQSFFAVAVYSLIYVIVLQKPLEVQNTSTWWVMAYFAVFATVFTFVLYNYVQKISTPMKLTIIFALEPLFGSGFAWVFAGERLNSMQIMGGVLIMFALVISEMPKDKWKKILKRV